MDWRAAVKVLHRDRWPTRRCWSPAFSTRAGPPSRSRHPNIIEIIDVGRPGKRAALPADGAAGGRDAGRADRRLGKLAVQQALEIATQAAAGLAAAHEAGVIHRDLKPDNMFLVPDPERPGREKVKVLDFGIAKLSDDGGEGPRPRTKHGVLLGTPAYMSPEQCRGVPVDHRCDIYALAIILHEMLAGKPPFISTGQGDLLLMQVDAPPAAGAARNPGGPPVRRGGAPAGAGQAARAAFPDDARDGRGAGGRATADRELPVHGRAGPRSSTTRPIAPLALPPGRTAGTAPGADPAQARCAAWWSGPDRRPGRSS